MTIELPEGMATLLKRDPILEAAVNTAIATFSPWIDSPMPFFPDFTDHSTKHLNRVLKLAEVLLRQNLPAFATEGVEQVTAADIAGLVLGVVLHDCAMHLTEESFLGIVRDGLLDVQIEPFTSTPWSRLWGDYLIEARRWDDRSRKKIFGTAQPRSGRTDLATLREDYRSWDTYDRLLIGEFVRRHHARMAHEFALVGVPGPKGSRLSLPHPSTFRELPSLAGLIARSHGMTIREAMRFFDVADNAKMRVEYKLLRPALAMSVIRIADYLDLYAERAPSSLTFTRRLMSRYSKGEWDAHAAIDEIKFDRDADPEVLSVNATPATANEFLKIQGWLAGIQSELDQCWAVLGETFGRIDGPNTLGLAIRRVRSNIELPSFQQSKTLNYVPCRARFDTSGADLLKLLVGPLYGDRPDVALREMMQNAVDAVLELREWLSHHNLDASSIQLEPLHDGADVEVRLCDGSRRDLFPHVPPDWRRWAIIRDRGIGMTVDTIINYFLRAGSSFRASAEWAREFVDSEGNAKVVRAGRFGVGALAAFLLGNQIKVVTRHAGQPPERGIAFVASLDDEAIELQYVKASVGTSVYINITDEAHWKEVSHYNWEEDGEERGAPWSWYCLSDPKVVRLFEEGAERVVLKQLRSVPGPVGRVSHPWFEVRADGFRRVVASMEGRGIHVCNGFCIAGDPRFGEDALPYWSGRVPFESPKLAIFDSENRLALTANRFGFAGRLPFGEELYREMMRRFALIFYEEAPDQKQVFEEEAWGRVSRGRLNRSSHASSWLLCSRGVLPRMHWHLAKAGIKRLLFLRADLAPESWWREVLTDPATAVGFFAGNWFTSEEQSPRVFLGGLALGTNVLGARVLTARPTKATYILSFSAQGDGPWKAEQGDDSADSRIFVYGHVSPASNLLTKQAGLEPRGRGVLAAEIFLDSTHPPDVVPGQVWSLELEMPAILPIDRAERRVTCEHAISKLEGQLRWYRGFETEVEK